MKNNKLDIINDEIEYMEKCVALNKKSGVDETWNVGFLKGLIYCRDVLENDHAIRRSDVPF